MSNASSAALRAADAVIARFAAVPVDTRPRGESVHDGPDSATQLSRDSNEPQKPTAHDLIAVESVRGFLAVVALDAITAPRLEAAWGWTSGRSADECAQWMRFVERGTVPRIPVDIAREIHAAARMVLAMREER